MAELQQKPERLRILVVDDERSIRKFLNVSLTSRGNVVAEASDGAEATERLASFRPDVVVLDLGLPDVDGVELIRNIRKQSQVPIVVLSVRDRETDKIGALDAGADDYVTKPFSTNELTARLRAVLRRQAKTEDGEVFTSGKLHVDVGRRLVKVGNREADLTPTEYEILKLLVVNAGRVLTHRQIIRSVWPDSPQESESAGHLLRVTISNLRGKIEPNPSRPSIIITEPAVGYRLRTD
ncbi:MAG: response regulator transcription factor [Candidatus Eisenbacteria bacterium]|nr:response regulator transcription factor [Candidatus Eisenbacteria bacterium]